MSEAKTLEFATRVLKGEGALVEPAGPGAIEAVLPLELQRSLSLEEFAVLTDGRKSDAPEAGQSCGYGARIFGELAKIAIGRGRVAAFETRLPACTERSPKVFEGLNLAFRVTRSWSAPLWTLVGFARYQATSDDERLGLAAAAVTAPDGVPVSVPDLAASSMVAILPARLEQAPLEAAFPKLLAALRRAAVADLGLFREAVARRRSRDAGRVQRYFEEMAGDLRRRLERRGGEQLADKLASVPGELKKRLAQLEAECVLRVRTELVALAAVVGPGVGAELEVRRRKHRRVLEVRYDGSARRWVGLRCDGCGVATLAFAMCDAASHVLCGKCWDHCGTGGHRPCFRCDGQPERIAGDPPRAAPEEDHADGRSDARDFGRCEPPAAPEGPPRATGVPPEREREARREVVPKQVELPLQRSPRDELRARVLEVLRRRRTPLSSGQIRSTVNVDAQTLRSLLGPLIEEGLVGRMGERRGTLYYWKG